MVDNARRSKRKKKTEEQSSQISRHLRDDVLVCHCEEKRLFRHGNPLGNLSKSVKIKTVKTAYI